MLSTIDPTITSRIKEVQKTYMTTNASSSTTTLTDKLWIPSAKEIYTGSGYENSGVVYTDFFNREYKKIKYSFDIQCRDRWWLRTPYSSSASQFRAVTYLGSITYVTATTECGVVIGFCLG